jgi:glycosyltransferase A (GT-A) superfamily protein (DUF2064 family)
VTDPAFAAVVLDALAGPRDPALAAALGPEIDDALRAALRRRTLDWARSAAPGRVCEARTAAELAGLLAGHAGPVLLVAPDVPGLDERTLAAVRDDLAAGVTFAFAPATDGRPFLVMLDRADPAILPLVGRPFDAELAGPVTRAGGSFGMLRPERRLASLADARALRADPLAPPELAALLPASL